jgi:hypothetical protein
MDDLLTRALDGVDLQSPDASRQLLLNLLALMPWASLIWTTLLFVVVGALLGWRRGRLWAGIGWSLLLGPIGWWVVWRGKQVSPPPLPGKR